MPLERGLGRVLAEDIRSVELPPFDNSSVDGFAVIAADVQSAGPASPCSLQVVADIPAGSTSVISLRHGEAARIMTGAPIPRNATAVIMLEDTDDRTRHAADGFSTSVRAYRSAEPGANVRRRGSDVKRGQRVLQMHLRLRPQDLAFLAMIGASRVRVFRRPRIALLTSGNELVAPHRPLRPGTVRDANSTALASLITEQGCEVIRLGIARDSRSSILALLQRAVHRHPDLILSSAGVSVGAFDLMRDVIQEHGRLHFWRVNVRPGKPLAVGEYRKVPFVGLPGNPVSAFVGFELFVRGALARLCGLAETPRRIVAVKLEESVESDGRESYLRAIVTATEGSYSARLTGHQGSGNLLSLVRANALLVVPAGVKSLAVGDRASAWLL